MPSSVPASSTVDPFADAAMIGRLASEVDLVAAVGPTPEERALFDQAWHNTFNDCLRGLGYSVTNRIYKPSYIDQRLRLAGLHFDNEDLVSKYGYQWLDPYWEGWSELDPPTEDIEAPLLVGDQDVECKIEANKQIDGKALDDYVNELLSIQVSFGDQIRAGALNSEKKRWEECMESSGYPGLDLFNDNPYSEFQKQPVSPEQISIALASSRCGRSSGWRDGYLSIIKQEVANWISGNEALIQQIKAERERIVKESRALLEAGT